MARQRGTFEFSANYEVKTVAPLDARQLVETFADLSNPTTWLDSDGQVWVYKGLIVSVANDPISTRNGVYYLNSPSYTDPSSWIQLTDSDSSLGDIYDKLDELEIKTDILDSSIGFLTQYNEIQDASIDALREYDTSQDASIDVLRQYDAIQDASINFLTSWSISQDSSILELRNNLVIIENSIGYLTIWNEIQDSSIIVLESRISSLDSEVIRLDGSINSLFSTDLKLEASINYNAQVNIIQDSSIKRLDTLIQIHDVSIGYLTQWNNVQDTSIEILENQIPRIDASLSRIDLAVSGLEASIIRIDSSIVDIYDHLSNIDTELIQIGDKISILDNSIGQLTIWNETQDVSIAILQIDVSLAQIYNTQLDSGIKMYIPVGGLDKGTTVADLKNDQYVDLLNQMLFPLLEPSLYDPDVSSFSRTGNYLYEVDENVGITFQLVFDPGKIKIKDTTQNNRVTPPYTYHYKGLGWSENNISSSLQDSHTEPVDVSFTPGINTYEGWVSFGEGPVPLDSYGNTDPSVLAYPAGDTSTYYLYLEGVYPLFATSVDSATRDTKQQLVSMLTGNDVEIELAYEYGGNKQSFDIPNQWIGPPTNRPLKGIETRNTVSLYWGYQGGSMNRSLNYWNTSTVTHNIRGNIVTYTRYTYNGDDRGDSLIRLKF